MEHNTVEFHYYMVNFSIALMKPSYNFYKILKKYVGIWVQMDRLIYKLPNRIYYVLVCSPYTMGPPPSPLFGGCKPPETHCLVNKNK